MASLHLAQEILDLIYPVGSIYMSVNSTDPSTLFGGTWETWGAGRVPVSIDTSDTDFNTVEKTGGSKTTNELRALIGSTHGDISRIGFAAAGKIGGYNYKYSINGSGVIAEIPDTSVNHTTIVTDTNGNRTPSIVQPYITCYMWKRTA